MKQTEFFGMKAAGALWDVGVSINRTNPLPLDAFAVFPTIEAANTYVAGVLAYPGQVIAVVGETDADAYLIITSASGTLSLKKLASTTASGDLAADVSALQALVGSPAHGETPATGIFKDIDDINKEIGSKAAGETAASGIYKYVDDKVAAATPEGYAGVKADVTKLVGTDKGEDGRANKTVREIAADEVAKIVNGAPEAYDTLKEVSDWISTHGTDAATMNTQIGENKAAIEKLNGTAETVGSVANTVNTAIDGALKADGKDKYALAVDLTTANGKITALETKTAGLTDAEGADMTVKAYVDAKETALSTAISTAKSGAESTSKSYTDTEIGKLSNDDKAVDNQFVTVVKETNGVVAVTRRGLTAADIPALEMGKISNLETALDAKQDTVSFNTEYNSATNKAATMADVDAAKTALVGKAEDLAGVDTIKGAKKYADEKSATALSDAKAYADGLVTGDSGITKRVETLEGKHATGKTVAEEVTAGIDALNLAGTYAPKAHEHEIADVKGLGNELSLLAHTEVVDYQIKAVNDKIGTLPEGMTVASYISTVSGDFESAKTGIEGDISTINTKIGTVPDGKTIVAMIEDAKTEATYDDTAVKADIADNKSKIAVLNGTESVDGSVKKTVKDAINDFATKVSDDQTVNTFKELVDYAASHSSDYSTLAGEVQKNTGDIATLNGEGAGSVKKTVADAITAIGIGDYAKTADVEAGYVAKETGKSLVSDTEITKLGKLTGDEQANVIEAIKVAGASADLAISEKRVTIPFATEASAGIVKASSAFGIGADGTISKVSTDLLFNGTNELILNGGEI